MNPQVLTPHELSTRYLTAASATVAVSIQPYCGCSVEPCGVNTEGDTEFLSVYICCKICMEFNRSPVVTHTDQVGLGFSINFCYMQ